MRKYYPAKWKAKGRRKQTATRSKPCPAWNVVIARLFRKPPFQPADSLLASSRKKNVATCSPRIFPFLRKGVGETTFVFAARVSKGVFDYRLPRQLLSILRRNEVRYGESLKGAPRLNICGG